MQGIFNQQVIAFWLTSTIRRGYGCGGLGAGDIGEGWPGLVMPGPIIPPVLDKRDRSFLTLVMRPKVCRSPTWRTGWGGVSAWVGVCRKPRRNDSLSWSSVKSSRVEIARIKAWARPGTVTVLCPDQREQLLCCFSDRNRSRAGLGRTGGFILGGRGPGQKHQAVLADLDFIAVGQQR